MRFREVAATIALFGCGTEQATSIDACDLGRRTLLVNHDRLAYDAPAELHVEGAEPGETVHLWWSGVEEPGCTCPDSGGTCFELAQPVLLGTIVADDAGQGTLELQLPPDEPVGTRWIQATTTTRLSARTPARVSARLKPRYTAEEAHYALLGEGIGRYLTAVGDVDRDGRIELAATDPMGGKIHLFDLAGATRRDDGPVRLEDLPDRITLTGPFGRGTRVTGIGDFDLDGSDDLVVSAPEASVLWMVPGGLPPGEYSIEEVAVKRLFGPGLGTDLAAADADGDGRIDLVLSAPERLLLSRGADLSIDHRLTGLVDPRFASVGDLDRDGRGDFVLLSDGGVYLVYGSYFFYASRPDWLFAAPQAVLGAAGDLDGDEFGDVLLGEPEWDGGRGRVRAVYGPMNPPHTVFEGKHPGERLGLAVSGVGDLNGDEKGEFVVTRADGTALLRLGPAFGTPSSEDAEVRFVHETPGWRFVAVVGPDVDVDGDGVHDLVLGSVSEDGVLGGVHVFRGAPGW